jgi:hypothetical protein
MSEYVNVKRPFLDKLRRLGWEVIDHASTKLITGNCDQFLI